MRLERFNDSLQSELRSSSFADSILWQESSADVLGSMLLVEVVVSEAAVVNEVEGFLQSKTDAALQEELEVSLHVHAKWLLEMVGSPEPAYTQSSSMTAACVVPLTFRSGRTSAEANVVITKLAEIELKQQIGTQFDLKAIARRAAEFWLRIPRNHGWNPIEEPLRVITAKDTYSLIQLLSRAA